MTRSLAEKVNLFDIFTKYKVVNIFTILEKVDVPDALQQSSVIRQTAPAIFVPCEMKTSICIDAWISFRQCLPWRQ